MRRQEAAFSPSVPPLRTLSVAAIPILDATLDLNFKKLNGTPKFCNVSNNRELELDVSLDRGSPENPREIDRSTIATAPEL